MITENDIRLGKEIKKSRKRMNLTQEQLAERLRLSTKYIQFMETGNRRPSLKTIYKIARFFKMKVRDLFIF